MTDKGVNNTLDQEHSIEQAHLAWQESMLRQLERLRGEVQRSDPVGLAFRCGGEWIGRQIRFNYWGHPIGIAYPSLEAIHLETGEPCSISDTALFLYYLHTADGAPLAERWISFRELPGGGFYHQAFQGYSGDPLARAFAPEPPAFHLAAQNCGGWRLTAIGEYAYAFQPLPRLRLAVVFWAGDDEFPAHAQVLFDAASSHYMTTDGLASIGVGLTRRLAKARR